MNCDSCGKPIEGDYKSSTKIGYIRFGKNNERAIKKGETIYAHPECKLTKEQLLDNWENGYFKMTEDEI